MLLGLFSLKLDLHVYAVAKCLRERGVEAHLFLTDDYSERGKMSFCTGVRRLRQSRLTTHTGNLIDVSSLNAAWWRRANQDQSWHPAPHDADAVSLINNEWRYGLAGTMAAGFQGTWVNYPPNDVLAGNKLTQLWAAEDLGFRIPATLVSNDKACAVAFASDFGGRIIAKKIAGITPTPLATVEYCTADLLGADELSFSQCPAMLQELIPGTEHLRIHVFGEDVIAARISSPHLDWRRDLSVPFTVAHLESSLVDRLIGLNQSLGLRMSIMDMKILPGALKLDLNSVVWIEVNPQGQFLFAQALAGMDLASNFANFLIGEAKQGPLGPQAMPFLEGSVKRQSLAVELGPKD